MRRPVPRRSTCPSPIAATARCGSRTRYGSRQRLFVTTDRLSAFDRVIAGVPYKGQVLNQLSAWWFERTADIVANHVVDLPDPNVLVARAAQPLPVEVIVRGYITGVTTTSLWRAVRGRRTHDLRLPLLRRAAEEHRPAGGDRHAHDQGGARRPRRAAQPQRRDPQGTGRARPVARGRGRRARAVRPRAGARPAGRPDPGRHEVRVRHRHQHGELMLIDEIHTPDSSRVLGGRHLRGAAGRRRGAGEPRQGGRAASLDRRRLRRQRRTARALHRRCGKQHATATSMHTSA